MDNSPLGSSAKEIRLDNQNSPVGGTAALAATGLKDDKNMSCDFASPLCRFASSKPEAYPADRGVDGDGDIACRANADGIGVGVGVGEHQDEACDSLP